MPDDPLLARLKGRVYDERYLRYIRQQPCCVCGGIDVQAHHIRVGSINHDKKPAGMAQKSSDRWAVPLCGRHHDECHAQGEMQFWGSLGIDPFALCFRYQVPR
jgi:hypothetical protein